MLFLRSFAFNAFLYTLTAVAAIIFVPLLVLPGKIMLSAIRIWAWSALAGLRWLAGTRFEVRGQEYVSNGPVLIASKHQSMWETMAIFLLLDRPVIITKRELGFIPFYGWFVKKAGMIIVNRTAHANRNYFTFLQ